MNSFKFFYKYLLIILSASLVIITLLSLIHDIKLWYYKVLDFPRIQFFIAGSFFTILFVLNNKKWKFPSISLVLGLIIALIIHGIVLYPYFLGKVAVPNHTADSYEIEDTFDVLISNVLMKNKETSKFINIVQERDPDILVAMEVDEWWVKNLEVLEENYPYVIKYPLDNAYGMSLYSKFPFEKKEIKFLKHEDVPSFHTIMTLPSGKSFNFYAVHPVAPVPSKKYPDNSDEKEYELLAIGNLVADNPLPSVVAGDFNDVSWSNTSKVFGESGGLKNVRLGRGLYNTFDSKSSFLRWPLDHYFVTQEFSLIDLQRLPEIGSDHFPLYVKFVLEPEGVKIDIK